MLHAAIQLIPTNLITTLPENGRGDADDEQLDQLIKSIDEIGLLHPITVTRDGTSYKLLSGARRLAACRALGRTDIRANIVDCSTTKQQIQISCLENLDRKQLTPIEEALACAGAIQGLGTLDDVSISIHRSVRWITERLDILDWPDDCKKMLQHGQISMSALKHLSKIDDDAVRTFYLEQASKNGITAGLAAAWLQHWQAEKDTPAITNPPDSVADRDKNLPQRIPSMPCFACREVQPLCNVHHAPLCPTCLDVVSRAYQAIPSEDPSDAAPATASTMPG